ncbi:hypothetical protein NQ117_02485 [Paenibacillus sp. SC116]|uniref:hypothetical protein n=1 Tax=Paenibacillus sp. SC116 TaxID=2968986 RepID=UPI00215A3C19|nr:hypothetical protein [Paenibacillus sp. SC116]MCR8842539.1 hypothetical protein [Paenibacillus sp. SC116]
MKKGSFFPLVILTYISIFITSDLASAKQLPQLPISQNNITKLVIHSSINKLTIRGTPDTASIHPRLTTINNPDNLDFHLTQDKDIAYLSINRKVAKKEIIDLLITLPPNLNIEIFDKESILELYDLAGEISITDNEKDIYIENTSNLSIKDKSGDIRVNNSSLLNAPSSNQTLDIEDGSGNINLININSSIKIVDRSGDVHISKIHGNVDITDDAGHINVKDVKQKVIIDDASGDIHVERAGDLILKETGSGNITYDKKLPISFHSLRHSSMCNIYEGIYIQKNGGEKTPFPSPSPIDIEPHSNIVISISNYKNSIFDSFHFDTNSSSLIPSLIRNIGEGASVAINIDNSANVELLNTLIVGQKNYDENDNIIIEDTSSIEPAFIKDLIIGTIASKSSINVNINNSANVTLANNDSTLHIGGGSLIESVINVPSDSGSIKINAKEINVSITNSTNINSKSGKNMGTVRIYKGQFINEMIDGRVISNSDINLTVEKSSNVSSKSITIIDGELIDELIDAEDIKSSAIQVKFVDTGNVNALTKVEIKDGELIDEMIDMENLFTSTINVSLSKTSNVTSPILSVYEGELIDETLDGEGYYNSNIQINFIDSSNFYGKQLFIEEGELVDEVIDCEISNASTIKINLNNTSNINTEQLKITAGELIDETVDIEDDFTNTIMDITLTSSAKAYGNKLEIIAGELVDEILDAANGIGSSINVFIKDTGNFEKRGSQLSEVLITDGELMDEILDVSESISMTSGAITIESTGNVTSDVVILTNSQLLDEIVDGAYIRGSTLFVSAINSANAKTPSLTLLGESILLPPIAIDSKDRSNIIYNVKNSGVHNAQIKGD